MIFLACYDVANDSRRRRLENVLREYGYRLQWSVYLLSVDPATLNGLWCDAIELLEEAEDSLRWYRICGKDQSRMVFDGFADKPKFGGNLVID